LIGLHGKHAPEFLDHVRVRIAVESGLNVSGMAARVQRTLLLPVNHNVTGPKTGEHVVLLLPVTALQIRL
jgi:hypothetical protein